MRNPPIFAVDPTGFLPDELDNLDSALSEARSIGKFDLSSLPSSVREQLIFALDSLVRGDQITVISNSKPLTTTEAASVLGMSRTHLTRLCREGRIPSFTVGNSIRIEAEIVMRILHDREQIRIEATIAAETAEDRRRERAARAAGIA